MRCQACKENNESVVLKDAPGIKHRDAPYHLCMNCLGQLVNLRLTRVQYSNLLKSGHKDTEFLLHDDFYNEKGKALQPVRFR
jgi:hypothetical protein